MLKIFFFFLKKTVLAVLIIFTYKNSIFIFKLYCIFYVYFLVFKVIDSFGRLTVNEDLNDLYLDFMDLLVLFTTHLIFSASLLYVSIIIIYLCL